MVPDSDSTRGNPYSHIHTPPPPAPPPPVVGTWPVWVVDHLLTAEVPPGATLHTHGAEPQPRGGGAGWQRFDHFSSPRRAVVPHTKPLLVQVTSDDAAEYVGAPPFFVVHRPHFFPHDDFRMDWFFFLVT